MAEPPVEMFGCSARLAEPVEVAPSFFELPAPVEDRVAAFEFADDVPLLVVERVGVFDERPSCAFDPSGTRESDASVLVP